MVAAARQFQPLDEVRPEPETGQGYDPAADGTLVLHLADLIPDAGGDIVLFNDSAVRAAVIRTDLAVQEEGRSGRHVTAAGVDVEGWSFMHFENGSRLYFPAELTLLPARDEA